MTERRKKKKNNNTKSEVRLVVITSSSPRFGRGNQKKRDEAREEWKKCINFIKGKA